MTQVVKVYQIAQDLGMDADVVVARAKAIGISVNNKMSKVDADVAERIRASLQKEEATEWIEVDMGGGVIRRKKKPKPVAAPVAAVAPVAARPATARAPASSPPVEAKAPRATAAHVEAKAPAHTEVEAPASAAPEAAPEKHERHRAPEAPVPAATEHHVEAHAAHEPAAQQHEPEAPAYVEPEAPAYVEEQQYASEPEAPPPARAEAPAPEPVREPSRSSSSGPRTSMPPQSVPPPAGAPRKSGIEKWNPATKQITHEATPLRVTYTPTGGTGRPPMGGTGRPTMNAPGMMTRPGMGGRPQQGRFGNNNFKGRVNFKPAGQGILTAPMGAEKRVVTMQGTIGLQKLAQEMSVKATDVMLKLLQMGTKVTINSTLDTDTAKLVAMEFNYEVIDKEVPLDDKLAAILPAFKDLEEDYLPRAPVVTVMGHVDHGKTTLLDAIIGSRVADGEAGGITQKVSAYRVDTKRGPVVFFDTPGHEAFTALRARGAKTTDVAVLVVAADDGVMPTTIEAIAHCKAAEVPIVVAINKMDKPGANPDRVVRQLMQHDLTPDAWEGTTYGGEVLFVKVSAKTREGLEDLLENLALQTDLRELKANPKKFGMGTVFDATLDRGRGVVARLLVQDGTLRVGDGVLAGKSFGKIRAMFDERGKAITKAGPSTPVEILGLNDVPSAGDKFYVVQDMKKAEAFVKENLQTRPATTVMMSAEERIKGQLAEGGAVRIGVIIKAEAQASVEALVKAFGELSTDKVQVQVLHTGIGGITENDVNLAISSSDKLVITLVVGFNVRPQAKVQQLAEGSPRVQLKLYNIIYEAVDDLKAMMEGQLKPTIVEKELGKAQVQEVFRITKVGNIAGCRVTEGSIKRTARARLVRDSAVVWTGNLSSLRRVKEDVREVALGYECGIGLENYGDIKTGDVIEAFETEEVAAKL